MNESTCIGFDMGMGSLKLWSQAGGLELVSQVATNGRAHLADGVLGLRSRKKAMLVAGDFGSFYAGESAHQHGRPVENLDFNRLTGAPEIRALLYAALARYQEEHGPFGGPLTLMVGLPLQMMTGEAAAENQKSVKSWLKGTHKFRVGSTAYKIQIEEVKQTSQPVGALFDYILDDAGQPHPERGKTLLEEVGVISVGFNTLELLVVKERQALDRFTKGNTLGVRRLLELLNYDGLYSLGELDGKLRAGELRAEIKNSLPVWAREVNGEIEQVWGRTHRRFARVLIVGGGALLLKDTLTGQFSHKAWTPPDPVLSIARGLWKLSIRKK
jgi:hypothetical protein